MFGAVIAQGRDDREVFQEFRPGFDLYDEREKRAAAGLPERFCEDGPYQDVRPALRKLRADGLWLGIAGNRRRPALSPGLYAEVGHGSPRSSSPRCRGVGQTVNMVRTVAIRASRMVMMSIPRTAGAPGGPKAQASAAASAPT